MLGRQERLFRAFLAARDWLQEHLDANDLMTGLVAQFSDTLDAAGEASTAQTLGRRLSMAATDELHDAIRRLREHHLKRIVAIAAAQASEGTEFIALQAVRLPRYRMPVVMLVAHARSIRDIVRPYEAVFVQCGCAPGFIDRLDEAIEEVEATSGKRNNAVMMQVGATAGLVRHLSDARRLLIAIDAQLAPRYRDDQATLATWRSAMRVRKKPGRKPGVRRTQTAVE